MNDSSFKGENCAERGKRRSRRKSSMEVIAFLAVLAGTLALIFVSGARQEKKYWQKEKSRLKNGYGKLPWKQWKPEQYSGIERYHEKHRGEFEIDDITWNDLGMDAVFQRIDYTLSRTGTENLYHVLRSPRPPQELAKREAKVDYYRQHEEERLILQMEFARLGSMAKHSPYDYLERLADFPDRGNFRHYLGIGLLLISAAAMCFVDKAAIILFFLVLCYNIFSYFQEKGKVEPYLNCFQYMSRLFRATGELEKKKLPGIAEEIAELVQLRQKLQGFLRGSYLVLGMGGGSDPFGLILDYAKMIFHFDLIRFQQMKRVLVQHTAEIDRMLSIWGELELIVCIGMYRASLEQGEKQVLREEGNRTVHFEKNWCIPVFCEEHENGNMGFSMENGYYPLLPGAVRNSLKTGCSILLTGSNASGKSTFLKTCAVNILFAQTIHTCLAEHMVLYPGRLYSSMTLKDDLVGGESYYMVEIKALKRILDAGANAGERIYCFVDEVLRGTNTVERIAASTELLQAMEEAGILCFAATHDMELTGLLSETFSNFHFEEEYTEGDISFSYRLKEGPARTRNAIRLLAAMGFGKELAERAEKRAGDFLRTGKWQNAVKGGCEGQ